MKRDDACSFGNPSSPRLRDAMMRRLVQKAKMKLWKLVLFAIVDAMIDLPQFWLQLLFIEAFCGSCNKIDQTCI
jgi:hypothetical protein